MKDSEHTIARNSKRLMRSFPARPKRIWSKARTKAEQIELAAPKFGLPLASNRSYIAWLKRKSMLLAAQKQAKKYSGKAQLWQNPYGKSQPKKALKRSSVWYTSYPLSMITDENTSIIQGMSDQTLWESFNAIGITGLHTGPMKQAGGLRGWTYTPSIDGHFDRISNRIDPLFGSEKDFKKLTQTARKYNAIIIDDIVPGHTGKGPDFRLAEMAYGDYPGIYHMVEIDEKDWHLLPDVPKNNTATNIDQNTEEQLKQAGYIIGRLQRVIFYEPGVKDTNWSVTKIVKGVDGKKRRWVYLHYFKQGQPTLNWLDPSFSAMKLVVGDALHSLGDLGTTGLRLDANGFLGVEISSPDQPAWSEGHPLSAASNHLIAGMVRKAGGFTFQELNLTLDDIRDLSAGGADLSYDFANRPSYHHAFITSDTSFLRMTLKMIHEFNINPSSLVHALQNHDDLTYELVHFFSLHKDDIYTYKDKEITGFDLREEIQNDIRNVLVGKESSYNALFATNGIACTTVSCITATLKYTDIYNLSTDQVATITRAHLLLASFNALQPGVFALSGWDLSGALPLPATKIKELLETGDTRWLNRGAYDLTGKNPQAAASALGIPKATALYKSLPQQLQDEQSFAYQLKEMLAVREKYNIASATQIEIVDNIDSRILVMIHRLGNTNIQITILNFSNEKVQTSFSSKNLAGVVQLSDACAHYKNYDVQNNKIDITLNPYQYICLVEHYE